MIATLASLLGFGAYDPSFWMPLLLITVLFFIFIAGVVLDGFDLGVGCLSLIAPTALKPRMLALLKPWRDANEFWLFLGIGLFIAAFPYAWSQTIGRLFIPISLLALGTLLRSVCFDLGIRSPQPQQKFWMFGFGMGAVLTAFAHGFILGRVVANYESSIGYTGFAVLIGVCAIAAYSLLGACWIVMRVTDELRQQAIRWALKNLRLTAVAIVAVSIVLDFSNAGIFLKWGDGKIWNRAIILWLILLCCFVFTEMALQRMISRSIAISAIPYALVLVILVLVLSSLGYSFFPFIVLDDITIWDAAAPVGILRLVISALVISLPVVLIFNLWVYRRMLSKTTYPG